MTQRAPHTGTPLRFARLRPKGTPLGSADFTDIHRIKRIIRGLGFRIADCRRKKYRTQEVYGFDIKAKLFSF